MPGRRPKPAAGRQKALSQEQQSRLLRAAESIDGDIRPLLAVRWMLETASRATEACHADLVAALSGKIVVARVKGSNPTTVLLTKTLRRLALELAGERRTGFLFEGRARCERKDCPGGHIHRRTLYQWIDVAGAKARLPVGLRHPHALRHTAIHNRAHVLQLRDMPESMILADLRAFSGHRDPDVLMEYLVPAEHAVEIDRDVHAFYEGL